ncbi:MAG TPA: RsmE family RNA methyltransferase [Polyangiaceae bacterium]|nr:RsmE family RNA methyltransferase [Polyangiaceae bacterium]
MTRQVRVPMAGLAPGDRTLSPEQVRYLVGVHRLRAGDAFLAFDPRAAVESDGVLLSPAKVRLGELREAPVVPARAVTWIHAMLKGDKCDAIVRDAAELGATQVVFVQTARVVAKADEKKLGARVERWVRIAEEAARQCGRGDSPPVAVRSSWEAALSEADAATHRFCLHPGAPPLRDALLAVRESAPLVFAAGPEGGFTDEEVAAARAHGFTVCSIGPLVLRTETVPAAVLGAVAVLLG